MRATPPSLRISEGTRSSAITAQAPASSAMVACSGVTTSMITPPFSICARPTLTAQVPVVAISILPCRSWFESVVHSLGLSGLLRQGQSSPVFARHRFPLRPPGRVRCHAARYPPAAPSIVAPTTRGLYPDDEGGCAPRLRDDFRPRRRSALTDVRSLVRENQRKQSGNPYDIRRLSCRNPSIDCGDYG